MTRRRGGNELRLKQPTEEEEIENEYSNKINSVRVDSGRSLSLGAVLSLFLSLSLSLWSLAFNLSPQLNPSVRN